MKFQGEHFLQTPRERVWAALIEPRSLVSALPGFQRLDPIGNHEYEGAFELSIENVRGDFQGTLELSDLQAPSSFRFGLNAMGAAGFVDGGGLIVLEDAPGGTRVHFDLDAKIGGRIAGVGEQTLDQSARHLARQALEDLLSQPTPAARATAAPAANPSPEPPAISEREPEPEAAPAPESASEATAPAARLTASVDPPPPPPANGSVGAATSGRSQSASVAARDLGTVLLSLGKRPGLVGAALLVYTLAVVLLTRACSG